ncbi:PTS system N-acetylglucosamine-specific EIICBA component [Ephemeroptericola cinctiostellae]|uniref:PTS system N-acetylglucosamine-specific EIICBA component n=1 Tax=Ephemeroptericola cinctiostellae TaxID=2268024 RepID=A0A345DAY3_9BURK|nr:PTS system N-acetylglucosamine-specific EIICBA component [Ephemeroptericola cinctiostellae]
MKISFNGLQQLGRALMLPIAVLPIAGLLLRLGQPDLLNIKILAQAGDAIFGNLPLLFAIGIAVGFAKENNGVAGLAGAIGQLILVAVLKVIDEKINMGVLSGVLMGLTAGGLYNKYYNIKLPPYLAFFGGKRFVAIITGLVAVIFGVALGFIWPSIQNALDAFGHWLIGAGGLGLFLYGALNRLLLVTGLHHVLNSFVWFVFGSFTDGSGKAIAGDLHRFFAGDPTAGSFMTGFFPIMMFGLPAACLAMYRNARPENKKMVGGVLLSMGLTSFLTGVTEPVEFAFMFLAPVLYGIHAVLTGLSLVIMNLLHVRLGFSFSAGLFDYLLSMGKGENALMLLPIGFAYFAVYYFLFNFAIKKFNLMTLGRELVEAPTTAGTTAPISAPAFVPATSTSSASTADVTHGAQTEKTAINEANTTKEQQRIIDYVAALGGKSNLTSVDACTTRLRLIVADKDKVNDQELKRLGARGVLRPGTNAVQVIIGPEADSLATEIREYNLITN